MGKSSPLFCDLGTNNKVSKSSQLKELKDENNLRGYRENKRKTVKNGRGGLPQKITILILKLHS